MRTLSAKFLSGAVLASFLFVSCKKDTSDIGLPLLGEQLHGQFTDTLTVITHTKKFEPLKFAAPPAALLCGDYFDPIFGTTRASFYTEVYPENVGANLSFGASPAIDSVVLSLTYKGSYYGNPAPVNFKVYMLSDTINKATVYYSNTVKAYNSLLPLASITLEPNTIDSVHADSTTYAPQLRIKLDASMLSGLTVPSLYTTLDNFRLSFKGLYIAAYPTNLSGARAIYSFSSSDPHSKMTLYYHDAAVTPVVNKTFSYTMGGNTARFNHFEHDYSTAAPSILTQVADTDINQESVVYIQGLGGLQTKIRIPYLDQLKKDGPIAINQAELIVRADPNTIDSYLSPPSAMVLVALDDTDGYLLTPDLSEGGSYSGGTYDAVNKEYRFNIGRYLQGVLNGDITDRGLMILPSSGAIYANRVVLGGGAPNAPYRMRLKLTYTKL